MRNKLFDNESKINIKEVFKICNNFLKVPSLIEHEKPFLDYLSNSFKKIGYKNQFRSKRYLVIFPKNIDKKDYRLLFSAHIDRHGLILNENQRLEYAAYYYKKKYGLEFKKDYYEFFLSAAQRHVKDYVLSYDEKSGKIFFKSQILRFDMDWKKKEVLYDIKKDFNFKKNKFFGFYSKIQTKDDLFFAQIDNVISAAVLFYIAKRYEIRNPIIFTTREEIGKSFENVVDFLDREKLNLDLIVLDTSPYENFKDKKQGFLTLREGDENGDFDKTLTENIRNFLDMNNIPYHLKPSGIGMTELGRISSFSKGKYNGTTLQLPTLNYHTTYESSTIPSLENYIKTIIELNKKGF